MLDTLTLTPTHRAETGHVAEAITATLRARAPRFIVHIAPPGSILMLNGSRAHRTATLRAIVTGQDGEHLITVGDFQILRCSCDDEPNCAHLEAYRFYL